MAEKTTFEILKKKVGFSQKWGCAQHFCWIFFNPMGPAGGDKFYEIGHLLQAPLRFSANRKKLNFGKIENDKSAFSDISWPLTSPLYWTFLPNFEFDLSH